MQAQYVPGELRYAIETELKGIGLVRYGTEFTSGGKVLIRHLKQQQYLSPGGQYNYRYSMGSPS